MDAGRELDISAIVDNQPVRAINVFVLALCFLAMMSDGYNMGVVSLVAPGVVREFSLQKAQIGPLFSSSLVGMLFGALFAGIIGDKIGRKRGILLATGMICLASFACALSSTYIQLLIARFAVGAGLGGLIPNVTALMSEFIPKKVRATFSTFSFMGITTGGILPGLVSQATTNWQTLFLVGGLMPLVIAPMLVFMLPESLKFLALRPNRRPELEGWLKKIAPDLTIHESTVFRLDEEAKQFSWNSLFGWGLGKITPTLWLVFICIMFVQFLISSWLTLMLTDIGFSAKQAAATTSVYWIGGLVGGVVMGIALDRAGPAILALFSLLGGIVVALMAVPQPAETIYILVSLIGFTILGAQVGMSAICGLLYPTVVRSKAAGFAHSIGRGGAIAGPLVAGALVSTNDDVLTLFLVPLVPLIVAGFGFFYITKIWAGNYFGRPLTEIKGLERNGE